MQKETLNLEKNEELSPQNEKKELTGWDALWAQWGERVEAAKKRDEENRFINRMWEAAKSDAFLEKMFKRR